MSEPGERRDATVDIHLIRLDPDLPIPGYAHDGDAGADLYARTSVVLQPGDRAQVPTGVALALPAGFAGFVHPRSGLAALHGVTVLNAPGTIDAGYRGEVLVVLVNTDLRAPFTVQRGDRIAQLVVQRVSAARFVVTSALSETARGGSGHGSSGGWSAASLEENPPARGTTT